MIDVYCGFGVHSSIIGYHHHHHPFCLKTWKILQKNCQSLIIYHRETWLKAWYFNDKIFQWNSWHMATLSICDYFQILWRQNSGNDQLWGHANGVTMSQNGLNNSMNLNSSYNKSLIALISFVSVHILCLVYEKL